MKNYTVIADVLAITISCSSAFAEDAALELARQVVTLDDLFGG